MLQGERLWHLASKQMMSPKVYKLATEGNQVSNEHSNV